MGAMLVDVGRRNYSDIDSGGGGGGGSGDILRRGATTV